MAASLLSEITLGNLTLKNRVVMAPLTRGRSPGSRVPNDVNVLYYTQRATAGLIVSEATAISATGYGWYAAPGCYTEEQAEGWKKVVDSVHEKGGKIFLQLWHIGRQGHPSFNEKGDVVAASEIKIEGDGHVRDSNNEVVPFTTPRALTTQEVIETVQDYKKGAALAKSAGFDGVEIHGANGYLIDVFLQSCSNQRTDQYGGSMENRYRFLKEIIEAVGEVYPMDRIGLRLSPNGGYGGMGSEDNDVMFPYVAKQLSSFGLCYLHVMDGLGFGFHAKCKVVTLFDIKKEFNGPVMSNVGHTKETAEGVIRSGAADMVAFGRPYLSNPDLVERFTNDWPLAESPPHETWFYQDQLEKFYTDYETYKP